MKNNLSDLLEKYFEIHVSPLSEETKKIWREMELEERRMQQAQSSEKAASPHE